MAHPQRHVRVAMLLRAKEALVEAGLACRVAGEDGIDVQVGDLLHKVSNALAREGIDGEHQTITEWPYWSNPEMYDARGDQSGIMDELADSFERSLLGEDYHRRRGLTVPAEGAE